MIPRIVPDCEAKVWTKEFVPIKDWQGYLNSQKMAGATEDELEYYEACHKREYPTYPAPKTKQSFNTKPVIVRVKVTEDNGVSLVVVENKLASMLRDYMSFGRQPPRKVWIEAMIQTGMDFRDVLACIVRKESRRNDRCELLEKKDEPQPKKVKKVLKPVVKIS